MMVTDTYRLVDAISAVCEDIELQLATHRDSPDERQLWWELSCCILSSQVPFGLAAAAAEAIDRSCLLITEAPNAPSLAAKLDNILRTPLSVDGMTRRYRFPDVRARHLAACRVTVTTEFGSLERFLSDHPDPADAREWLVRKAPGVGPKQASMFLRNCGISYNLAILDRHVVNYMALVGLTPNRQLANGMNQYRRLEASLRSHAESIGFPVGLLDWAIWIVMRVAGRPNKELALT